MAIICPPSAAPTGETTSAGWKVSKNRRGTYIGRKGVWTKSGLKAWAKPCFWLSNQTLWDWNKLATAQIASYWKESGDPALSTYTTNAPTFPFTNIRQQYAARNGFSLYTHTHKVWQLQNLYTQYTLSVPQTIRNGGNFQTAAQESDLPVPAITSATFNSDGTWSMSVSNQPDLFDAYDYMLLYLSPPGQSILPIHTPFQASPVTSDWGFSNVWNDNGDGLVAGALKPFPVGSAVLMGLRGLPGNIGSQPGALAAVGVTVT